MDHSLLLEARDTRISCDQACTRLVLEVSVYANSNILYQFYLSAHLCPIFKCSLSNVLLCSVVCIGFKSLMLVLNQKRLLLISKHYSYTLCSSLSFCSTWIYHWKLKQAWSYDHTIMPSISFPSQPQPALDPSPEVVWGEIWTPVCEQYVFFSNGIGIKLLRSVL